MKITDTSLSGAKMLQLPAFADDRGSFVKTFHETTLKNAGIDFTLRESYYSLSKKDVIRGMHFQLPPHHHSKIVFCPYGAILDVIMDLRKGSPTYGKCHAEELSGTNCKAYFIPEGFAHGFKSLCDDAITYYLVSSEYSKEHDTGVLYSTIDFNWELTAPIVSPRDLSFPALKNFESPF